MAGPAEVIQLDGVQPLRILYRSRSAARLHVRRARPVARLAAHAGLGRRNRMPGLQLQLTRGVTAKASQRRRHWIEGPVAHIRRIRMAGGARHRFRGGVVSQSMLDVIILIEPADIRDRLRAGAEGPRTGLSRRSQRQGWGMAAGGLYLEPLGMA